MFQKSMMFLDIGWNKQAITAELPDAHIEASRRLERGLSLHLFSQSPIIGHGLGSSGILLLD